MTIPSQLDMFGKSYTGGKQADLFVQPVKPLSDASTIARQDDRKAPSFDEHPRTDILRRLEGGSANLEARSASECRECGDVLPPKAKVCPNCYTKREEVKPNAEHVYEATL